MQGSADDAGQNIERHFDDVKPVDPERPEQVGQRSLQSVEQKRAYRDAYYSADPKLEQLKERPKQAAHSVGVEPSLERRRFIVVCRSRISKSSSTITAS